jgi:hypothetical protein
MYIHPKFKQNSITIKWLLSGRKDPNVTFHPHLLSDLSNFLQKKPFKSMKTHRPM